MKSRTSCYDTATANMNLRRFAPAFVLYAMGLLLTLVTSYSYSYGSTYAYLDRLLQYTKLTAVLNFGYAFVLAQLLFGDLYNTRLCYAVHAMPVSRSGWYGTQIVIGLLASLLANLLNAAGLLAIVKEYRVAVLAWLAVSEMQFLFFYGAAVFSAVMAGNRIGLLLTDGIVNFLAVLVFWYQKSIFLPLVYGLERGEDWIVETFSPLYAMVNSYLYEMSTTTAPLDPSETGYQEVVTGLEFLPHIRYCALCALAGIVFIFLGLRLFRKRPMEKAGDLLAFDKVEPVFLVLYTLCFGSGLHLVAKEFGLGGFSLVTLFLGLIIGWFTGLMLLKRQVQVFRGRAFGGIALICGALLLALTVAGLDILGISSKTLDAEDVAKVTVSAHGFWENQFTDDPEIISLALDVQKKAMEEHAKWEAEQPALKRIFGDETVENNFYDGDQRWGSVYLGFQKQDGSVFYRRYWIREDGNYADDLRAIYSRPGYVFSRYADEPMPDGDTVRRKIDRVEVAVYQYMESSKLESGEDLYMHRMKEAYIVDKAQLQELFQAILADCEEHTISQDWLLHPTAEGSDSLYFQYTMEDGTWAGFTIEVFPDSSHTMAFLEQVRAE